MKVELIAMDCDGTVEGFGGPIPIALLRELNKTTRLLVIGNRYLQSFGFDGFKVRDLPVSGLDYGKSKVLREWKVAFPDHSRYIVVDDNPSQYLEGWEGWEFMSPHDFLKEFNPP